MVDGQLVGDEREDVAARRGEIEARSNGDSAGRLAKQEPVAAFRVLGPRRMTHATMRGESARRTAAGDRRWHTSDPGGASKRDMMRFHFEVLNLTLTSPDAAKIPRASTRFTMPVLVKLREAIPAMCQNSAVPVSADR